MPRSAGQAAATAGAAPLSASRLMSDRIAVAAAVSRLRSSNDRSAKRRIAEPGASHVVPPSSGTGSASNAAWAGVRWAAISAVRTRCQVAASRSCGSAGRKAPSRLAASLIMRVELLVAARCDRDARSFIVGSAVPRSWPGCVGAAELPRLIAAGRRSFEVPAHAGRF